MIRYLVMMWWGHNEKTPGQVESILIELDELLGVYQDAEVVGDPETGYCVGVIA